MAKGPSHWTREIAEAPPAADEARRFRGSGAIGGPARGRESQRRDGVCSYVDSWAMPPIVVVAKSAKLRFRLRRKLRPLPCSSSPHRAGRGGGPIFGLAKRETGRARSKEKKRLGALRHVRASALYGGRRIGASADLARPSGTLWSSASLQLPSRAGWCRRRRGARTHLTSFSFTVSRCGAPSISVTSVPLVPPSARSASLRATLAGVGAVP